MTAKVTPPDALDRRYVLMGMAMLATAGLAAWRQPRATAPPLAKGALDLRIPKGIGSWTFTTSSGLVLPTRDALSDELYADTLTRVYRMPGGSGQIMLLIAYSNAQDGLLQVHRPEVCYPAGGFRLTPTRSEPIKVLQDLTLPARFFTADTTSRVEQVLYWTRIGSRLPAHWADQRFAVLEDNLAGIIPDGALVRISTLAATADEALPLLVSFARDLALALDTDTRALLFGRPRVPN